MVLKLWMLYLGAASKANHFVFKLGWKLELHRDFPSSHQLTIMGAVEVIAEPACTREAR
jgi:hypothetical protein